MQQAGKGDRPSIRSGDVEVPETFGIRLKPRIHLQNDPILVDLTVAGDDLSLPKRIIERLRDGFGGHAESGCAIPINLQLKRARGRSKITLTVLDFGKLREFFEDERVRGLEKSGFGGFDGELILRLADPVLDGQILHRLEMKTDPFN